jgi:hypothetical protein
MTLTASSPTAPAVVLRLARGEHLRITCQSPLSGTTPFGDALRRLISAVSGAR